MGLILNIFYFNQFQVFGTVWINSLKIMHSQLYSFFSGKTAVHFRISLVSHNKTWFDMAKILFGSPHDSWDCCEDRFLGPAVAVMYFLHFSS
jgi:hypothetical protein